MNIYIYIHTHTHHINIHTYTHTHTRTHTSIHTPFSFSHTHSPTVSRSRYLRHSKACFSVCIHIFTYACMYAQAVPLYFIRDVLDTAKLVVIAQGFCGAQDSSAEGVLSCLALSCLVLSCVTLRCAVCGIELCCVCCVWC